MKLYLVNADDYNDTCYIVRAATADRAIDLIRLFAPDLQNEKLSARELATDGPEGIIAEPPEVFQKPQ